MANISDFLPRVTPFASGVSEIMAERSILDSAIEFCRRTMAVVETKTLTVPIGGTMPAITFATGMQAFFVLEAYWDKRPIQLVATDQMDAIDQDWRNYNQGQPRYLLSATDDPDALQLVPLNSVEGELIVRFATMPTRTATVVPDSLANFWPEAIAFGALSKILRMPNQPFSSPQGSKEYDEMFKVEISKARLEAMDQRTRGRSQVQLFAFGSR